jgi:putative transposase
MVDLSEFWTILDEYTRECLAIVVEHHVDSEDVIDQLFHLFVFRGIPKYLRSDNGPEFTAKVIRDWLCRLGVTTLFIKPGSPWEKGYRMQSTLTRSFLPCP